LMRINGTNTIDISGVLRVTGSAKHAHSFLTPGALLIGDINSNFGGANDWRTNMAGLMMECLDNTEICVHDAGHRVTSLLHFTGGLNSNLITIGRSMVWGIPTVHMPGNLGIGTTTPTTRLHVVGSTLTSNIGIGKTPTFAIDVNVSNTGNFPLMNFRNIDSFGIYAISDHIANRGNTLRFLANDYNFNTITTRELLTLRPEGNIGIGTSNPNAPLQFANSHANRKIVLWETTNNDHQYYGLGINGGIMRYQTDNITSDHVFYAGTSSSTSAELMRIRGNGNVGIGKANPSFMLDIAGNVFIGSSTYITTSVGVNTQITNILCFDGIYDSNTTANSCTSANKIRIHNVPGWIAGFGISPNTLNYHSGSDHAFWTGSTDRNYGSERMRILNDGKIGIGTGSPAYNLDVVGTIRASSDVLAFSDSNFKFNLEPIMNAMAAIKEIQGYKFDIPTQDNKRHVGVLAQEVEKVLPEVVYTQEDGKKSVAYGNIVALLIEGIKELQNQIDELRAKVN
jgi:hypothetical protein